MFVKLRFRGTLFSGARSPVLGRLWERTESGDRPPGEGMVSSKLKENGACDERWDMDGGETGVIGPEMEEALEWERECVW